MSKNPLEKFAKLYDYLKNFSVYEERNIAREIGVPSPTTKTKNENIDYIVNICAGLKEPSPRSNKGAPTKSLLVDKKWLEDIRSLTDQIREKETYRESDSDERIHVSDSGHTLRFGYGSDLASGYLDSDPASGKFCLVYNRKGSIFSDISVPKNLVALHDLRRGDKVSGYLRDNADGGELAQVESVNSLLPEEVRSRRRFEEFTPCFANEIVRLGKKRAAASRSGYFKPARQRAARPHIGARFLGQELSHKTDGIFAHARRRESRRHRAAARRAARRSDGVPQDRPSRRTFVYGIRYAGKGTDAGCDARFRARQAPV